MLSLVDVSLEDLNCGRSDNPPAGILRICLLEV